MWLERGLSRAFERSVERWRKMRDRDEEVGELGESVLTLCAREVARQKKRWREGNRLMLLREDGR